MSNPKTSDLTSPSPAEMQALLNRHKTTAIQASTPVQSLADVEEPDDDDDYDDADEPSQNQTRASWISSPYSRLVLGGAGVFLIVSTVGLFASGVFNGAPQTAKPPVSQPDLAATPPLAPPSDQVENYKKDLALQQQREEIWAKKSPDKALPTAPISKTPDPAKQVVKPEPSPAPSPPVPVVESAPSRVVQAVPVSPPALVPSPPPIQATKPVDPNEEWNRLSQQQTIGFVPTSEPSAAVAELATSDLSSQPNDPSVDGPDPTTATQTSARSEIVDPPTDANDYPPLSAYASESQSSTHSTVPMDLQVTAPTTARRLLIGTTIEGRLMSPIVPTGSPDAASESQSSTHSTVPMDLQVTAPTTARRLLIGTTIEGRLMSPIVPTGSPDAASSPTTSNNFLIRAEADLKDTSDQIVIPKGASVVCQVISMDGNGRTELQARRVLIGQQEYALPESAISIRGADGMPILADKLRDPKRQMSRNDRALMLSGALSKVGEVLNQSQTESSSSGGSTTITTVIGGRQSLGGAALNGAFSALSQRQADRAKKADQEASTLTNLWYVPSGRSLEIYVNQSTDL